MSEASCPDGDEFCLLCHYEGLGMSDDPRPPVQNLIREGLEAIGIRSEPCQHPRDDLYRHHLTMPNGMFPVVCTRCWGQSMSSDPTIPLWTMEMYWRHIDTIEGPERAARIRKLAGRA